MPTFGNTEIEALSFGLTANEKRVYKQTMPETGSIESISIYLSGGASSQVLKAVLYADNGSGAPGALLATSPEGTIGVSQAAGWVTFTFAAPVSRSAGDVVFLGYIAGATNGGASFRHEGTPSGPTRQYILADTYSDGPTDPFGTASSSDQNIISIYATYTATGGAAAPAHRATSHGSGTATTALTVDKPSGVVAGDLMLAVVHTDVASLTTDPAAPTGWTKLDGPDSLFYGSGWAYAKVAGSSEPASYTWTFSASGNVLGFIEALSGASATLDASVLSYVAAGTGGAATSETIQTNGPNRRVVTMVLRNGTGGVADSWTSAGATERDDFQETGGHTYGAVYDEEKAAAGSVSRTFTPTAGNATNNGRNALTFIAAVGPAAAGGGTAVTFGETNVLPNAFMPDAGQMRLYKFAADQPLSLSKLSIYAAGTAVALKLKGVVYADSGGSPAAKVAEAPEITVAASSAAAWRDMTFATPPTIAAGTYWIGFLADATAGTLWWGDGGTQWVRGGLTYASGGPDPAGSPLYSNAVHISIYATGTPTGVTTPPSTDRWGFAIGFPEATWPDAYRNDFYQRMFADGARRVRFDVAAGVSGDLYDKHVTSALAAGLKVLMIVVGSPSDTTTSYANRATAIATFYKNRLVGAGGTFANDTFEFELMNEPNYVWSASAYAAVAKAGSDAIKTVYANANLPVPDIQLGGIGTFGAIGNPDPRNPDNWLSAIQAWNAANGGSGWYSKVQYHHYGYARNRNAIDSFNNVKGWIEKIRSLMVAGGDAAKPIVFGEGGAPTWSDGTHSTDWPSTISGDHPGVPEDVQADILRLVTDFFKTLAYADDYYNYNYRDNAGLVASSTSKDHGTQHGHFGLRYNNYDPKPALSVWLAAVGANPAQAPANTVAPSISGTPTEGSQLTANEGTWTNDPIPPFAYQWKRAGVAISGATSKTYIVQAADVGQAITVTVTGTNAAGSTPATSAAVTGQAAASAPAFTAAPAVTGTAQVGETLSCSPGTVTGTTPITRTYQWQRDTLGDGVFTDIPLATLNTYRLTPDDHGDQHRCRVTATNAVDSTTANSNTVGPAITLAPANTTPPAITGTAAVGQTLTVTPGTWANTPVPPLTYQWKRAGAAIAGATGTSYVVQAADAGATLSVTETASNAAGSASATSAPTAAVPGSPPAAPGGSAALTDADAALIHAALAQAYDPDPVALPRAPTGVWKALDTDVTVPDATVDLWTGYIERYPRTQPSDDRALAEPAGIDLYSILATWPLRADEMPEQLTSERVKRLLDKVGWSPAARRIDPGKETLAARTIEDSERPPSAKPELELVATSEDGAFFVDQSGYAIFHSRDHRTLDPRSAVPLYVFGNNRPAGELPYLDPVWDDYDVQKVRNDVDVATATGLVQNATDYTSRERYGRRHDPVTTSLATPAAALAQAQRRLARKKDPHRRLRSITLEPARDKRLWPAAVNLRFADRIRVLGVDYWIERVEHTVRFTPKKTWVVKLLLASVD